MAIVKRICKICGNEYEYCHTTRKPGVFRWQDVACSPEHASEYLAKIRASRASENAISNTCDISDNIAKCAEDTISVSNPEIVLDDDDESADDELED